MPTITIGPEFFSKAKNDYNDWHWAIVREFNQNGMDCGSRNIEWDVEEVGGQTIVIVRNDGEPMSDKILIDKLLSLGSSGKDGDGENTGGFGKAKEILYFCHEAWRIHTGSLYAEGRGGDYELHSNGTIDGTESRIVIDGEHAEDLKDAFNTFVFYGQWKGTFHWNGESHKADMKKGTPRRDLGFGQVYTNKSCEYQMVVRMNGQPMFIRSTGLDRCVVVELHGHSVDCLTSNRDGMSYWKRQELDTFVTELSVDKRSALRPRQETYRHYDGSRLCHRAARAVSTSDLVAVPEIPVPPAELWERDDNDEELLIDEIREAPEQETVDPILDIIDEVDREEQAEQAEQVGTEVEPVEQEGHHSRPSQKATARREAQPVIVSTVAISEEFVIKNETELVVPTYYRPDEADFSTYSRKLARIWGRLMLQLHRTFNHEADFAIGFLFSEDDAAQFEDGQFGRCYLIAPASLVSQENSASQSWRKAFQLTQRNRLLSIATHEFIHGLGYDVHDEEYASKLTDAMETVMDNRKDFNWAWR